MSKQEIDIEALLVLAFRDRQIDKNIYRPEPRGPSATLGSPMSRIAELGTMIQSSGKVSQSITTVVPNEYDDMIAVYNAVVGLEDYYAEFQTETRVRLWTADAVEEAGSRISETGTKGHVEYVLHQPKRMPRSLRPLSAMALIVAHARSATRPDCFLDWQPVSGRKSRKIVDARGRVVRCSALEAREVSLARATYQVWLASLEWLVAELSSGLSCYDLTGPIAPDRPWLLGVAA